MLTTASQQFEGVTIEDALESAVSTLGDDIEIVDAQKVRRRGLFGLRRYELFEVTATGKPKAEPKNFGDVLARMVDRVDEAERSAGADLSDTDREWWSDADFVVPAAPAPALQDHPEIPDQMQSRLPAATQELDLRDRSLVLGDAGPGRGERGGDPVWSEQALLELGLPGALVSRALAASPGADLDWVAALAGAIADLIDTARAISGSCELTGHGSGSAVQLLQGACDGFMLDSLIIDGRRVPATPLELSLSIRTLLQREPSEARA